MHDEQDKKSRSQNLAFSSFLAFAAGVMLLGTYWISGLSGLKSVLSIVAFAAPFYMIISLFGFSLGEKIILSLAFSWALFPLVIYWINQMVYSFRTSIIISLLAVACMYFVVKYSKRRWLKLAFH